MDQAADYITKEKRKALLIELEDLKGPKRREILASLEYAKSLGDLSENAEYHQTREEQGKLEERIAKIEQILQSSQTVQKGGGDVIEVGSNVVVQKEGKKEDIIRTRIFVTDISKWEEIGLAHGEIFREIKPVTTMIEVKSLISKEYLVEIEASAIIQEE